MNMQNKISDAIASINEIQIDCGFKIHSVVIDQKAEDFKLTEEYFNNISQPKQLPGSTVKIYSIEEGGIHFHFKLVE